MRSDLINLIEKIFQNSLYNLNEIINYSPPLYDPNWNKKFIEYNPSTRVPDKKKSKFKFDFKKNNSLKLENDKHGVYLLLGYEINFAYIGCTDSKLSQRFTTHIQKITATNLGRFYTPINWDNFIVKRYEKLKEKSVLLDDIKLTFFDYEDFENILKNNKDPKKELEALIYCYFKKKLGIQTLLNSENRISKHYRYKYNDI